MKIKLIDKSFQLDIKRCYLPIVLTTACPRCFKLHTQDLSDDYLSYPSINGEEEIYWYCDTDGCENEFSTFIKLGLNVEEVKK